MAGRKEDNKGDEVGILMDAPFVVLSKSGIEIIEMGDAKETLFPPYSGRSVHHSSYCCYFCSILHFSEFSVD